VPALSAGGRRSAALLAGSVVVGLLAAVVVSDVAGDGTDSAPGSATRDGARQAVPVLSPESGGALSDAVRLLGAGAPDDGAAGGLLGSWGAVVPPAVGEELPEVDPEVDDGRIFGMEAGPVLADPCIEEPAREGCPDPAAVVPALVDGDPALGANAVVVHAFPRPDARLVAECGFDGLAREELAIAVATSNPGTVEVRVGSQIVTDDASADEVAEFEAWRSSGDVPRPPSSFVAHCLAVPRPSAPGPTQVRVVAVDDAGQIATAETTVVPSAPGAPGPTVTPVDGTMVRVDVPLRAVGDVEVFAVPAGPARAERPSCPLDAPTPGPGWRLGSSTLVEEDPTRPWAPYVRAFPRLRRITVALPEGEPSLLCVDPIGIDTSPAELLVTPPDGRRLTLGVTEVDGSDGIGDEDLVVLGTFPAVAWAPCAAVLDVPRGVVVPGSEGVLCASGGDTGAIAAAGGVLDVSIEVDDSIHLARIALSAMSGGEPVERYRLPIPAPGLDGVLCTDGVDQPGCVPPEGDAVLGTIEITAQWDEGPTGPPNWLVAPAP
jgi:hypothetical protein